MLLSFRPDIGFIYLFLKYLIMNNRQTHKYIIVFIELRPFGLYRCAPSLLDSLHFEPTTHPSGEKAKEITVIYSLAQGKNISEYSLLASGMKGNLQAWPCSNSCSKDSCTEG